MSNPSASSTPTREITCRPASGWPMLAINFALLIGGLVVFVIGIRATAATGEFSWLIPAGPLIEVAGIVSLLGHFTLQPNEARVLILFGDYRGTARESGFAT